MMRTSHRLTLIAALTIPLISIGMPAEHQQKTGFYGEIQLLTGGLKASGKDIVTPDNARINSTSTDELNRRDPSFNSGFIMPNVGLSYLFNQGQNDVFWRSSSEPTSEFTNLSEIGFSHRFHTGTKVSLIISPAALGNGNTVWQDPFASGDKRNTTQAETNGMGFDIENLLYGSLSLSYRYNDTQINKERSGSSLNNLSQAQKKQLIRDNSQHDVAVEFINMMSPQTYLIGGIRYTQQYGQQNNMDANLPGGNLSLYHISDDREYYAQLTYRSSHYKNHHVIFDKRRKDEDVNVTAGVRFHQLLGNKWIVDTLISGGENQSNINFYDKEYYLFALGVSREF